MLADRDALPTTAVRDSPRDWIDFNNDIDMIAGSVLASHISGDVDISPATPVAQPTQRRILPVDRSDFASSRREEETTRRKSARIPAENHGCFGVWCWVGIQQVSQILGSTPTSAIAICKRVTPCRLWVRALRLSMVRKRKVSPNPL